MSREIWTKVRVQFVIAFLKWESQQSSRIVDIRMELAKIMWQTSEQTELTISGRSECFHVQESIQINNIYILQSYGVFWYFFSPY